MENCLRLTLSLGFSATKLFNDDLRQTIAGKPFPRCATFPAPVDGVRQLSKQLKEKGFEVIVEQRELQPFMTIIWHDHHPIDRLMELAS